MIRTITATIGALALTMSTAWAAECPQPSTPSIPDGSKASLDEMLAAKKQIGEYQTANADYRNCLSAQIESLVAEIPTLEDKQQAKAATAQHQALVDTYNQAVSAEENVANQFNSQIGAYKKANP